ncbi:MAG: hypothetical protein VX714_03495 [Bacteroidota bacterium]|nr:hypothetical protein [Bacteroidota bacterium]
MTSKNKDSHQYIKFEKTDRSLDIDFLPLKFSSDLILDLSTLETMDKEYFFSLNQINQKIINAGFCLVIVLKDSIPIISTESLNIVPTLIEAEDYLKMEQIQRDLGTSL